MDNNSIDMMNDDNNNLPTSVPVPMDRLPSPFKSGSQQLFPSMIQALCEFSMNNGIPPGAVSLFLDYLETLRQRIASKEESQDTLGPSTNPADQPGSWDPLLFGSRQSNQPEISTHCSHIQPTLTTVMTGKGASSVNGDYGLLSSSTPSTYPVFITQNVHLSLPNFAGLRKLTFKAIPLHWDIDQILCSYFVVAELL